MKVLHGIPESSSSRAGLSLLAYCYFYLQDFGNAASYYEQLTILCPDIVEYKLYHAQSLYQAFLYDEAFKVTAQIDHPEFNGQITKLQAAIKYGEDDLMSAKSLVDSCPDDDPDSEVNLACLLFKVVVKSLFRQFLTISFPQEGRFEEALEKFTTSLQTLGFRPYLSYNVALCYYRLKEYGPALKHIGNGKYQRPITITFIGFQPTLSSTGFATIPN